MNNVKLGVVFPSDDENKIKKLVETGKYSSVSHFIREATREKLKKKKKNDLKNVDIPGANIKQHRHIVYLQEKISFDKKIKKK